MKSSWHVWIMLKSFLKFPPIIYVLKGPQKKSYPDLLFLKNSALFMNSLMRGSRILPKSVLES